MPLKDDAINEIMLFCPEGLSSLDMHGDLLELEAYKESIERKRGHQPGIAKRGIANRTFRQTTLLSTGVAQFIANRYADGVRDNGDVDAIEEGLVQAIINMIIANSAQLPPLGDNGSVLTVTDKDRGLIDWTSKSLEELIATTSRYTTIARGGAMGLINSSTRIKINNITTVERDDPGYFNPANSSYVAGKDHDCLVQTSINITPAGSSNMGIYIWLNNPSSGGKEMSSSVTFAGNITASYMVLLSLKAGDVVTFLAALSSTFGAATINTTEVSFKWL